ncbi:unnamed protein product [Arabidopsis halleri]
MGRLRRGLGQGIWRYSIHRSSQGEILQKESRERSGKRRRYGALPFCLQAFKWCCHLQPLKHISLPL